MIYPKVISQALDMAITGTIIQRGEFINDMWSLHASVNSTQTTIKLLLSMDGGSLKKELYDSGLDVTPSLLCNNAQKYPQIYSDRFYRISTVIAPIRLPTKGIGF